MDYTGCAEAHLASIRKERSMSNEQDLSEGFPEYQKPPADVVPKIATSGDVSPIPVGPQTMSHYEWDENGVTKHTEQVWIAHPITPNTPNNPPGGVPLTWTFPHPRS